MTNQKYLEQMPLSLADVKKALDEIKKRDTELNHLSNKTKEYLDAFVTISYKQKEELYKKLTELKLNRLKEEHYAKIIDFLPRTVDELKIVLQAYPLSMPKKDQESIVAVITEMIKE